MPLIGSRLRQRRVTKTMTVKNKTLASGQYTEGNLITNLSVTHDPKGGDEVISEGGDVVVASDVFWAEPATIGGSLPAITESNVLVDDSTSVRYEVIAATVDQAGGGNRLKVMTRRVTTA